MGIISCRTGRGWGDAAFPQAMPMGQLHMFPKWLESWTQMQWKMVCLCVLFHVPGFLDSQSHTGKFIILLKLLSHSLISVGQSVSYRLLLEQRQPHRKQWQKSRQLLHPLCEPEIAAVMEDYTPHPSWTVSPTASCSLSQEKNQINRTAFALCCTSHHLTFLLTSSKKEKMKPGLTTGRYA